MQSNLIWVVALCMHVRPSIFCDGSRGVLLKISYECINCRRVRKSVIARNAPYFGKSVLQVAAIYWILFALTKNCVKPPLNSIKIEPDLKSNHKYALRFFSPNMTLWQVLTMKQVKNV